MNPASLSSHPFVQGLGLTLLDFVWQGALVALGLAAADVLLAKGSARLRYAVACAALLAMALLPLATFAFAHGTPSGEGVSPFGMLAEGRPAVSPARPSPSPGGGSAATEPGTAASRDLPLAGLHRVLPSRWTGWARVRAAALVPWAVLLWALGVAALSVRFLGSWLATRRLMAAAEGGEGASEWAPLVRRLTERLRLSRPVVLARSALVEVPTVAGWLKPVLLVPVGNLAGLTAAQAEAILAHELAHVRRHDYLVNLLQSAIETLLFYHPAVWWVSHRVRVERENCCDDVAVEVSGDPLSYARALVDLDDLRPRSTSLAVAADGGSLLDRVRRLVKAPAAHPSRSTAAAAGLLSAGALVVVGLLAESSMLRANPAPAAETPVAAASTPVVAAAAPVADDEDVEDVLAEEETTPVPAPETAPAPAAGPAASPGKPLDRDRLSISDLIRLRQSGLSGDFIDEMAALGYTNLTLEELVRLRNSGVTARYVREMAAAGYPKLPAGTLVDLRNNGVSPADIQEIRSLGYEKLTLGQLRAFRNQGVTPEYIRSMKSLGYGDLSAGKLMALRNQGVTPGYVRAMREAGFPKLSAGELIGLRNQGVTPEFIRSMKEAGYPNLTTGELLRLRNNGVSASYASELKKLGYDASVEELIQMHSRGVSVEFIRGLKRRDPNRS